MSSSPDDFFNSFEAPAAAAAAPRPRKPPPPPPPPKRSTTNQTQPPPQPSTNVRSSRPKPQTQQTQPNARPSAAAMTSNPPTSAVRNSAHTNSYYGASNAQRTTNTSENTYTNANTSANTNVTSRTPPPPPQANSFPTTSTNNSNYINRNSNSNSHQDPFTAWSAPPAQSQPQPHAQPFYSNQTRPPQARNFATAMQHDSSQQLQGVMDGGMMDVSDRGSNTASMNVFVPQPTTTTTTSTTSMDGTPSKPAYYDDDLDDLPLLEELGVNIPHILMKTKAVVLPSTRMSGVLMDPSMIVEDADLAGPLCFALLLGGELLLTGKVHFGYIYGFGVFGCLSMTLILNLMAPQAVSVWTVASILGYSLIPVNVLAALKIVLVNLANLQLLGRILAMATVVWSTIASTRLLEVGCNMREQRYLLAYPIALLYSAFVLITIF